MNRFAALVFALGVSLVGAPASADVLPPAEVSCQGRTAGAECTLEGSRGSCVASRCTRLDYPGWDRDAMPSPPTIEYDCVVCEPRSAGGGGGCSVSREASSGAVVLSLVGLAALVGRWRRASRRAR